jgi:DNA-binding NarL/FixJ family response regulator
LQKHPDAAVVDVMLPDLAGFELTLRIRKDDPAAKIVMLSVSKDPAFVLRAVAMAFRDMSPRAMIPGSWLRRSGRLQRGSASSHRAERRLIADSSKNRNGDVLMGFTSVVFTRQSGEF